MDRAAHRGWRPGRAGAERRGVLRQRAGPDVAGRGRRRAPGAGPSAAARAGGEHRAHAARDLLAGARSGQHTDEVLGELGYQRRRRRALHREGVV